MIAVDESIIGLPERLAEIALVLSVTAMTARIVLVALVVERNEVLAKNIREAARSERSSDGASVVAVVGLVHLNGVKRRLLDVG